MNVCPAEEWEGKAECVHPVGFHAATVEDRDHVKVSCDLDRRDIGQNIVTNVMHLG